MSTLTPIAQSSFANSTAYNTHRPTYPAYSLQHLLEQCRVAGKKGARIVDLGAGTGIFTEALAAREEGFEIVAVEPHADMRAVLEKRNLPGVKVVDGTAEDVPVEDGWADAVLVAQVGGFDYFLRVLIVDGVFLGRLSDEKKGPVCGDCDLWWL
jgi:SAM-dependent methyltransferase